MKINRIAGSVLTLIALATAAFLYNAHPVRGSDHQDSPTVVSRPRADITDVFVFPSPSDSTKVVFIMNVDPLLTPASAPSEILDPAVMYQFKITHGPVGTTAAEDQVIQVSASGTTPATQMVTLYGPSAPNVTGTQSTFVTSSGSFAFNQTGGTTLGNGVKVFVGPRADPFFFDLFAFFKILPDRLYSNPRTGDTLGTAQPTFNGFNSGDTSGGRAGSGGGGYACSTAASQNALTQFAPPGFNVLSIVLEVPKTLLTTGFSSQIIHVWATTSTTTGS
jgi:hypothetical protein